MNTIHLHQNRMNPLVLPLILAQELDLFTAHGVTVDLQLSDTFIFNGKEEFLNNKVTGMMGDTTFFFYYLEEGKKAKITSTLTRTIQLVGKKTWASLDTLTVGINRTGLFRFFQDTYLTSLLPPTDYAWINNTYERMTALKQDDIQALVAIEPFVSHILGEQEDTEVIWHSNTLDACYVMWCFDAEFVEAYPESIKGFHLALSEAEHYFNTQPSEEKIQLLKTHCQLTDKQALTFADFQFEPSRNYSPQDYTLCQNWMLDNNEITQKTPISKGLFQPYP